MEEIDLAAQTMFAELLQRTLDAEFDAEFPEKGTFKRKRSKGRFYWHYQWRQGESVLSKYVGPVTDTSITDRVGRFVAIKSSFKRRRTPVRALIAAGLPTPDPLSGAVVEAMWKAGFFRLRGVLFGTLAFQAYAGALGVKLGSRPLMAQDADFAQSWGISENIGESISNPLAILQGVDPTFRAIPNIGDPIVSTRYRNRADYAVDFLTPNRGSAGQQGKPARMKALGGAGAQPLRHLEFLIHQPERSVLLFWGRRPGHGSACRAGAQVDCRRRKSGAGEVAQGYRSSPHAHSDACAAASARARPSLGDRMGSRAEVARKAGSRLAR
jgi:hypothetical protein